MKKTYLKKYNKDTLDKRKEERKDFPEFYKKHIQIIKDQRLHCEECGHKLLGDVSEVAHILNKSFFKSISTFDNNILYLCSWKGGNNCHSRMDDSSIEDFKNMKVYEKCKNIFNILSREITEKINYKIYDRFS